MRSADFTCIRIVGGLLPPDLLGRILSGDKDLGGLTPSDYHLPSGETPKEAANRAWGYLLGAWSAYRQALAKLPEGDPAVGVTRERWLTVLFKELGYGRVQQTPAGGLHADDKAFPVSHLWGAAPLHLLGWGVELDRRTKGVPGAADRAPQAMLQELLNRNHDYLWAMLSNGRILRLLRDSTSLAGQSYVEFDLESMFDGEVFSDFALMFVMLHQSRVEVPEGGVPSDCWLERWRTSAAESGTRALGLLRDGVKDAIEALGTGFLQSPGNDLGVRISDGELRLEDYHRSLLRLVYRLLFLFVAEDRGLLQDPAADQVALQRYRDYFSTGRLRALARKRRGARHTDLWQGLQLVISGLGDERGLPELGLPGLGGIFNHEPIDVVIGQRLPNEALLTAIRRLSVVQPKNSPPRIVDYRNLGAEELGSIYESLLELVPRHDRLGRIFTLENLAGNDRKTSGSYYTPTSLIDLVLDQALDPLLDEAEKEKNPEQALLARTICDPACGSGHFLVAAARRIASRLATVRTGELDPTPADVHEALHDVVARCIYGIDLNPMAAELAKVSLWLEAMQEGRPLSFLDAHIKVGNALLGVTPRLLEEGLPDAAFVALTGDDKAWTSSLKKRNKAEREQADQGELFTTGGLHATNTDLATKVAKVDTGAAPSLADAHQQAQRFRDLQTDPDYARARQVADAWCAAFVQPKRQGDPAITHSTLQTLQDDPGSVDPAVIATIEREAIDYRFFHWHLEFPQVFRVDHAVEADPASGWSGGFTAMLGNPPWDHVQLHPNEWFASKEPAIAAASNMTVRDRLIKKLSESDPDLWQEFTRAQRAVNGLKHFVHASGRYPLTAYGRLNTYSLFAELFATVVESEGQAGLITPTGLMTDAFNQFFAAEMLRSGRLGGFTDFENSQPMFDGVHRSFRFAITCMTGRDRVAERVPLAFMLHDPSQALMARFELSNEEILLLNPNTGTLPVFASRKDAEITLKIYRRFPVLVREANEELGTPELNPWGLKLKLMFMMNTDSDKFRTREELEAEGFVLQGNVFVRPDDLSLSEEQADTSPSTRPR